ncbi:MAG TPA: hypothetical protein DCM28_13695 [Phycisphaerales bacterium]|nr:hypothetical protein [Phycisphaerales bacterium]HCD31247.1 hypothetical protein [Phycisphaerales bacterium]
MTKSEFKPWIGLVACGSGFYFIAQGLMYALDAIALGYRFCRMWLLADDHIRRILLDGPNGLNTKVYIESEILKCVLGAFVFLLLGVMLVRRVRHVIKDFTGVQTL